MNAPRFVRGAGLAFVAAALSLSCGDDGGAEGGASSTTGSATTSVAATTSGVSTTTGAATTGAVDSSGEGPQPGTTTSAGSSGESSSTGEPGKTCDGSYPKAWIDGTACGEEPPIQVHYYDENTVILRQSLCTSFEGPFMYMFFGEDQVLLEDTGDGGIPVTDVVYGIIDEWLTARGRESIELVVVNSHAHGDHVQGNAAFTGQPNTTVVGTSVAAVSGYFGIDDWPTQFATHDLGGRQIDVVPIPGHQGAHIALFDHDTGLLLTGDTLYPGRLYIGDFATYVASIERLVDHVADQTVCNVLGTHIEMTDEPGEDFEFGATMHPNERALPLDLAHLIELRDAVVAMGDDPQLEVHDDFIVFPLRTVVFAGDPDAAALGSADL